MLFVFLRVLRGNLRVLRGKNSLSVFAFPFLLSPVLPYFECLACFVGYPVFVFFVGPLVKDGTAKRLFTNEKML